jgi:chromosome segregation ATPase
MGLVEATKITLENREDLVVDLSTEMVEKDLQVEQMATQIQELEELVGARENTIEVLKDRLINTQQQLEEANCWGPSASEGPQKYDLTMFLEYNV